MRYGGSISEKHSPWWVALPLSDPGLERESVRARPWKAVEPAGARAMLMRVDSNLSTGVLGLGPVGLVTCSLWAADRPGQSNSPPRQRRRILCRPSWAAMPALWPARAGPLLCSRSCSSSSHSAGSRPAKLALLSSSSSRRRNLLHVISGL